MLSEYSVEIQRFMSNNVTLYYDRVEKISEGYYKFYLTIDILDEDAPEFLAAELLLNSGVVLYDRNERKMADLDMSLAATRRLARNINKNIEKGG